MSVIRSYFFCFLAIDNDIMRKMCTLITSKCTDIDKNIANQNHATRTRTPKPGYLKLTSTGPKITQPETKRIFKTYFLTREFWVAKKIRNDLFV